MELAQDTIHLESCIEGLARVPDGTIDLAFADPPFNIGYKYDVYNDKKGYHEYLEWTKRWMGEVSRVLKPTGTFWIAIGDDYAAEIKLIAQNDLNLTCRSWVLWYYTFGVNCTKKFSRSHTHLFHFVKDAKDFTFNTMAIRVPSARQLVYNDGRYCKDGRLPDDTWILRPQDIPESFKPNQDTWYFPRINGTFKERAGFHGCQMPEQLLARIIRVSSRPRDLVLDPFSGSGTTLVVAKKLGRRWLGFDISEEYVTQATKRIDKAHEGDQLEGAPEPLVSAPATAEGKPRPGSMRTCVKGLDPIVEAFLETSRGFSTDRVIADPELNQAFVDRCRVLGVPGEILDWNQQLLRLRKAGQLANVRSSARTPLAIDLDYYIFASEIAMKRMLVEGLTLDEVLCDPEQAKRFDTLAATYAPGYRAFEYRWAALTVRKRARRWRNLEANLAECAPLRRFCPIIDLEMRRLWGTPGVYLLRERDAQSIYAGETDDLARRFSRNSEVPEWRKILTQAEVAIIRLPQVSSKVRPGYQLQLISRFDPTLNWLNQGD